MRKYAALPLILILAGLSYGATVVLDGASIQDNTITSAKLIDNNVNGGKILDNTLNGSKVLDNSVTNDKFIDNTINGSKMLDNSVSPSKLSGTYVPTATYATDTAIPTSLCYGGVVYTSTGDNIVLTLPAVLPGMSITFHHFNNGSNMQVMPNSADRIRLDGTALADNTSIHVGSTTGSHITLIYDSADGWSSFFRYGTWTSP